MVKRGILMCNTHQTHACIYVLTYSYRDNDDLEVHMNNSIINYILVVIVVVVRGCDL